MTKPLALLLAAAAATPALAADAPQMSPGMWEIVATMEMPGLPFKIPPQTVKHCYTKEELAKAESSAVPEPGKDCKLTEQKRVGNKLTWKVVCTGKSPGTGEGEIVFASSQAYDGTMKMETGGRTMTTRYAAKRVGDCK